MTNRVVDKHLIFVGENAYFLAANLMTHLQTRVSTPNL